MTRRIKPARHSHLALARVRLAQERLKLADAARHDAKMRRHAKQHSDQVAKARKRAKMQAITDRIEGSGFGMRPLTPSEDAVRTTINEAYARKHDW